MIAVVQASERHLLRSAQSYELAQVVSAIEARGQQSRAAGLALISGRYAERFAAIQQSTPAPERAAALARLRDEQTNEVAAFQVMQAAETRVERRVVVGALRLRQRQAMSSLTQRQRRERVGSMLRLPRTMYTVRPSQRFGVDQRSLLGLRSRKAAAQRRRRPKSSRRPIARLPKDA